MKKKNLFLIALLCAYSTLASAWNVTFSADGKTAYIEGSGSDGQNLNDLGVSETAIKAAETLIFTGTINTLDPFQGGGFTNATTVDYSRATFIETTVGTVNYQAWNPTTKTYESAQVTKTSNCMTFKHFPNVSTAILANVKTLCATTFDNNFQMKTTFEIPSSVEYIAGHAVDDTPINNITIPATVKYIEAQAFQNAEIDALIKVVVKGYTAAEHGAFDKDVTVGQTVANKQVYASLFFPEGAEEYFTNLNHALKLEESLDQGKFQAWLNAHYEVSGNGWQDFINSAPGEPVESGKIVLRTFSDNVPHYVPLCYRAFIVNGVVGSKEEGFTMQLQETFAIPANTGVIIYGEAETGAFALPLLSNSGNTNWYVPYNRESGIVHVSNKDVNLKNYLKPILTSEQTKLKPYFVDGNGNVSDRNFVMSPYSSTDLYSEHPISNEYVGFFRVKATTSATNRAYLSLPAEMFDDPEGAEVKVVYPYSYVETPDAEHPASFRQDEWPRDYHQYGDWGTRPTESFPVALRRNFGEPFSSAIMNMEAENEGGDIYTLQGVKVSAPQKGIYLRNGKKFLVK